VRRCVPVAGREDLAERIVQLLNRRDACTGVIVVDLVGAHRLLYCGRVGRGGRFLLYPEATDERERKPKQEED